MRLALGGVAAALCGVGGMAVGFDDDFIWKGPLLVIAGAGAIYCGLRLMAYQVVNDPEPLEEERTTPTNNNAPQ
jgi:hypothetical protein